MFKPVSTNHYFLRYFLKKYHEELDYPLLLALNLFEAFVVNTDEPETVADESEDGVDPNYHIHGVC